MLTPRQQAFVNFYVICRNGSEAARLAGYSKKTAHQISYENLRKPEVIAAIAENEATLALKLEIDRNTIVGGIISGISEARRLKDPSGIIRGWLEISKITGFDKPDRETNTELSTSNKVLSAQLEAMSDEELLAIVEGR